DCRLERLPAVAPAVISFGANPCCFREAASEYPVQHPAVALVDKADESLQLLKRQRLQEANDFRGVIKQVVDQRMRDKPGVLNRHRHATEAARGCEGEDVAARLEDTQDGPPSLDAERDIAAIPLLAHEAGRGALECSRSTFLGLCSAVRTKP